MFYYIVVYDCESDRIRRRIVKELNAWGNRVQKSVFEIAIPVGELEDMKKRIKAYLGNHDSFRVYFKDRYRNEFLGKEETEFKRKPFEVA